MIMTAQEHRDCFGTMFPDDLHLKDNRPNKGKVFTVWMKQVEGGVVSPRTDRIIETDIEQWDDCQQCPEFDSCYKLCLARVTLESTLVTQ
jgi:hypothetical protein